MHAKVGAMGVELTDVAQCLASVDPWTLLLPNVDFTLHTGKKSEANPQVLKDQFCEFLDGQPNVVHIYTDGSKNHTGVAAAAVSNGRLLICRLRNNASIFTAEAPAIILALKIVDTTNEKKFYIFSDSLSCLQALQYPNWGNPVILEIVEKVHHLQTAHKEIKFC
jgi:ribonuclease HI